MKKLLIMIIMISNSALAITAEEILSNEANSSISINPITKEQGEVRKGTIAATIANSLLLDELIAKPSLTDQQQQQLVKAIIDLDDLIISGNYVGIYDFFTVEEWLNNTQRHGRVMAALLFLAKYPSRLNKNIIDHLNALKLTSPKLISNQIEQVLAKRQ